MKNIYFIFPKDRVDDEPVIAAVVIADYDKMVAEAGIDILNESLVFTDFLLVILALQKMGVTDVGVTGKDYPEPAAIKIEAIFRQLGFKILPTFLWSMDSSHRILILYQFEDHQELYVVFHGGDGYKMTVTGDNLKVKEHK